MTPYDSLAEKRSDDECRTWVRQVINSKAEIVAFVTHRLHIGGEGTFLGFLKDSFNLCMHIGFEDGHQDVVIRFPKPGHTVCRAEKVTNEVHFIEYLSQHTTIPVPRIRSWGLIEESPEQLGPFIIMDFIQGTRLSTFLKQPTKDDQEDVILDSNIDDAKLDIIYDQLADYMLQISQLDFSRIEAISKDQASGIWSVTARPLAYNMNDLATSTGYPIQQFNSRMFDRASNYFKSLANDHLIHLRIQPNLARDIEDAQTRFIARHQFPRLIDKYCIEDVGPFKVFCDDMQPSNMLVDPETLRITAVLDWEFTDVMPAQFAYDPPSWLLLLGPDMWLEHYSMKDFVICYTPRLHQFPRALERVETANRSTQTQSKEQLLSVRMRESWETGRFWFNYAARKSLDVDAIYYSALNDAGPCIELLDENIRAELEPFTRMKLQQLKAYRDECAALQWNMSF